ncbi:MAG: hypothetical protein Q7J73_06690 [Dehalococcoidales bacterium]|nr:hypothetical protein [Dehalococcoidales bacterium]
MKNTGKMPLALKLAKLVRFQRTNHGWADGIYDDSLPIFHRRMRLVQPAKPSPKTLKQFRLVFPWARHYCLPKFYFFLTRKGDWRLFFQFRLFSTMGSFPRRFRKTADAYFNLLTPGRCTEFVNKNANAQSTPLTISSTELYYQLLRPFYTT